MKNYYSRFIPNISKNCMTFFVKRRYFWKTIFLKINMAIKEFGSQLRSLFCILVLIKISSIIVVMYVLFCKLSQKWICIKPALRTISKYTTLCKQKIQPTYVVKTKLKFIWRMDVVRLNVKAKLSFLHLNFWTLMNLNYMYDWLMFLLI